MKHTSPSVAIVTLACLTTAAMGLAASIDDDTFSDGVRGPQWVSVIDDASHLNLAEEGGRLDVLGQPGGTVNDDALYLSTFRLSTAADFTIRADYGFTSYAAAGATGTAMGVVFGVGRDADGTDSAAIGQGFGTTTAFGIPVTAAAATVGYRIDDMPYGPGPMPSANFVGTFEIAYDADDDDLTLRRVGSGISYTLADTVRQVWGADSVLVSLGGRGDGFTTTAGQAYLDNFMVVNGTLVPEPAGVAGVVLFGLCVGRRRCGR